MFPDFIIGLWPGKSLFPTLQLPVQVFCILSPLTVIVAGFPLFFVAIVFTVALSFSSSYDCQALLQFATDVCRFS